MDLKSNNYKDLESFATLNCAAAYMEELDSIRNI